MPLQLDADLPEPYLMGKVTKGGPRAPKFVVFCSGPYGSVCSSRPIYRTLRAAQKDPQKGPPVQDPGLVPKPPQTKNIKKVKII